MLPSKSSNLHLDTQKPHSTRSNSTAFHNLFNSTNRTFLLKSESSPFTITYPCRKISCHLIPRSFSS